MRRSALKADPAVVTELCKPSPLLEVVWAAREVEQAGLRLVSMNNDPDNRAIREACQDVYDRAAARMREVLGNG